MDQFKRFTMKNIEIGPSVNGQLKVNSRYSTARLMLLIFSAVAKQNPEVSESFNPRGTYNMNDVNRLVTRMDLAFEYA